VRKAITLIAIAAVAAGISAGAALAATTALHPYKATFSGRVTEKVVGDLVSGTVAGTGSAGTLAGTVKGSQANACSPLSGPGTIKSGKNTLKIQVITQKSRACAVSEDDKDHINVTGKVKVLGGTGKYARAGGVLAIKGTYNRSTGTFSVKFLGSIRY